ncbi:MAG: hypothetical protein AABY75_08085 [Bacteroidota bacterium]
MEESVLEIGLGEFIRGMCEGGAIVTVARFKEGLRAAVYPAGTKFQQPSKEYAVYEATDGELVIGIERPMVLGLEEARR